MSDDRAPSASRSNAAWLADLRAGGARQQRAVEDLRDYLLRAIIVYLTRSRGDLAGFDYEELRQFAEDWAQQALIQVVERLDTFRGDSKFTTWAYRVAVNLAAGELRRKRWANVSLDRLTEGDHPDLALGAEAATSSPEAAVAREQIWTTIQSILDHVLSDRQRTVLTRIVVDGASVEDVAAALGTNRNNVYKILHDARRRLRREVEARSWSAEDVLAAFGDEHEP